MVAESRAASATAVLDHNLLESRTLMKEKIVSALRDPHVTKIGIYGKCGVGKTFLAQQVARQLKGDMFDDVCIMTLSQNFEVEGIQVEMLDQLDEEITSTDNMAYSLEWKGSVLIILDDVWENIDLERLGIPSAHNGCKLLLTSRRQLILEMNETRDNFQLEVLDDSESWSLFQTRAGDDLLKDSDLRNIAEQLVRSCGGLPRVILATAALLRDVGASYGEKDFELEDSFYLRYSEEMEQSFYSRYDELGYDVKQVLWLCAVCGKSISFRDLLKHVTGLGVLENINSIDDARNQLHDIIDLLDAHSLVDDHGERGIQMHDLFRKFAQLAALRTEDVYTREAYSLEGDHDEFSKSAALIKKYPFTAPLEGWPSRNFLRKCSQMILEGKHIRQQLPVGLDCHNLKLLRLDCTGNRTLKIPDSFFKEMAKLQVLDLMGMDILPELPKSLFFLANLQTLCLNECSLGNMTGIGALTNLEILSFSHSSLKEFPSDIGKLTRLRMLDLSSCEIPLIPPKTMSNLTKLEELYMGRSSKWGVESLAVQKDIIAQLLNLTSLTTLELQIHMASNLPYSTIFEKLERYNILIGHKWEWSDSNGTSRLLKLNLELEPSFDLVRTIKALAKRVEDLHLEKIKGFSNLIYELNDDGFRQLKKLHIQNNTNIQHIVHSSERNQAPVSFPNLETMILDNLKNLEEICHGSLKIRSFRKLKVIKVKSCGRLEYLFSASMIKSSQLVEIEVSECTSMKYIVLLDSETSIDEIEFISLHSLTLQRLPVVTGFRSKGNAGSPDIPTLFPNAKAAPLLKNLKLISISGINHLVLWNRNSSTPANRVVPLQDLETMEIGECIDLNCLFFKQGDDSYFNSAPSRGGLLPKLRQLCLRNLDSFTTIVDPNNHLRILNLKMLSHLSVYGCNRLIYLLPQYVLEDLQQLKNIDISNCVKLQQVFVDEQDTQTTKSNVMEVLPLLHSLKLSNLPELVSICSGACHVISHSLTQMTVENCPNFIFTFEDNLSRIKEEEPSKKKSKEMIVTPSEMENLNIRKVDHLKNMGKDPLVRFTHLTYLQLEDCNKLEYLFSLSMAQELSSLQELKIISCQAIEQIVRRETEEGESANIVEFPQVKTLTLEQLPKFIGSSSQNGVSVKWLMLETVQVTECPNIQKSMLGMVDRRLLKNITVANCRPWENGDLDRIIGYLFNFTDVLYNLEHLKIEDSMQLQNYMEMELEELSFTQLKTVEVLQCGKELNNFLSILLHRSNKLKRLTVERCKPLYQVFDLTGFNAKGQRNMKFRNLNTMQLLCLPNLRRIWNKNPRGIVELGKLVKLEIIECGFRKSILSTAIVEGLVLLEELKVESCEKLKQVIEVEKEMRQVGSFPHLKNLQLVSLPELIRFNSRNCNFRFPNLLSLTIEKCPKLKTFTTGFLSNQIQTNEKDSVMAFQSLKIVKVKGCDSVQRLFLPCSYPSLTKIDISECQSLQDIFIDTKIKEDEKCFPNLESIVLENLPFLSSFCLEISEFPKLQKAILVNCSAIETFSRINSAKANNFMNTDSSGSRPFGHGKTILLPLLQELELSDLSKMQLWNQEPQIPVFEKLTSLKIMGCGSIKKLFSISVAQHLSSLKLLTLYKCENIVQVLQGEIRGKQVFKKLETLVLKHLPRITSFCEEDVDFGEFPELKMIRVEHVPNMNTFVKKPLNTPKLKQVHVTYITKCWRRDLNQTIKYLHQNRGKLKDEVWESDQSTTEHQIVSAESSSQAGLSGSGKSTVVNLLLCLYEPTNGQILIDGVPLNELDIMWWRERIGFVGQEPKLFRMDISSNIRYGCTGEITQKDVEWAVKQAYARSKQADLVA